MTGFLLNAFIYLLAAVIMVPLAKRLGLGSVLGYLIAGVIIGPLTGLVGQETQTIQHFAEYGVVMMLFLVGLELDPQALWKMRNRLLGLGGLQVGLTTAAVTGLAMALGQVWSVALAIGLIFSLSSTAIVLQTFNEKGLSKREEGDAKSESHCRDRRHADRRPTSILARPVRGSAPAWESPQCPGTAIPRTPNARLRVCPGLFH